MTIEPNPSPSFSASPFTLTAAAAASVSTPLANSKVFQPIVIYNSLAWERDEIVNVRVATRHVRVVDGNGKPVLCQVDATWADVNDMSPSQSAFTLSFIAKLPALGAATYFVQVAKEKLSDADSAHTDQGSSMVYSPGNNRKRAGVQLKSKYVNYADLDATSKLVLENELIRVEFSHETGLIKQIADKTTSTDLQFQQSFARSVSLLHLFRHGIRLQSCAYLLALSIAVSCVHVYAATQPLALAPICSVLTALLPATAHCLRVRLCM